MAMSLPQQIEILFSVLDRRSSSGSMSPPGFLADILHDKIKNKGRRFPDGTCVTIMPEEAKLFGSAAVEMWCRSVHSFLISCAVFKASPIWASVCGYYASHYCVRGLAHLMGHFHMVRRTKCRVELQIQGGRYCCNFYRKKAGKGEHKYYWMTVKSHAKFKDNEFFTSNPEDDDISDVAHRSIANYYDHVNNYPMFVPLDKETLIERVAFISKIELTDVPIPSRTHFPDIGSVQLVAYHRIVIFRNLLNGILGNGNNFWKVHRNPHWCRDYINFQVVQSDNLKRYYFF